MRNQKTILIINGSASAHSSNGRLIEKLRQAMNSDDKFNLVIWPDLKTIPHFDADLTVGVVPSEVGKLRTAIDQAVAVVICTPEYVFSIPSGLKNALEWCVATTIFTDKPVGIITASADGRNGHEELQLIMRTLGARLSEVTTILIQGIKGKISGDGEITDPKTKGDFERFVESFRRPVDF